MFVCDWYHYNWWQWLWLNRCGSLCWLIHNIGFISSLTCFPLLYTNSLWWQKWSSHYSMNTASVSLGQLAHKKKIVHRISSSDLCCWAQCLQIDIAAHKIILTSMYPSGFPSHPCHHLGLIIKIFQAVLNVHKK